MTMVDTTPLNLTPARRTLLRAVADGRVRVDVPAGRYAWIVGGEGRTVTAALRQLRIAGLVRIPDRLPASGRSVVAELTDAGREADCG
jgi:DNA-binding transcriptional ArsR family regulator